MADHAPLAPSTALDNDDATLHHSSISDDTPSPVGTASAGAPGAPIFSSAKASASSFASKLAFGGRKLLSTASGGGKDKDAVSPSAGDANKGSSRTLHKSSSSLPSADSAVASAASAASAVTSSISSFLYQAGASVGVTSSQSPGSTTSNATTTGMSDQTEMDQAHDAEFRQVTAQQRMHILEELVQHRRHDWSYLKAMHEGTNHWLNIAVLRESQVLAHLGEKQSIRRSVQFFYLGLGLGRLISDVRHAQFLAMEGCQLLEELEFYFSSATVQSMKLMVATSTPTLHQPLHKMDDEGIYSVDEPFRPTIYKWNQRPVFRRLLTPSIPFPLDYREVMLSLCDILALVYSKFVEDNICSENIFLFQAIVRFDEKIKKLVIDPVKKEFSAVAASVLNDELTSVRKAFSSGGGSQIQPPRSQPSAEIEQVAEASEAS
ncbi:hypothetical protein Poli38472_010476 [Pythium oligandrum]|uniref:Uncharacterized protein n=1 Tax=Pythium oligandrum TaxID=41045 RepID=A0A8K1C382_PYTOL|nr:hypothetical protein Poli38472_010476 [Pythium oligandrum]|eukprot:TMW55594.1 hypothetical protein Poli38472_010476 [Pythium oligandrum]